MFLLCSGLCLAAIAVYLIVASGGQTYDAKLAQLPRTESDCRASGGTWTHGPFQEKICQRLTSDSGKSCSSAIDCEGACVSANENATQGHCSDIVVIFGCNMEVERNHVLHVCRD